MSTRTTETGETPAAAGVAVVEPGQDRAGRVFRQVTVLPTLLAMAWLLAGLPLLLAGHFSPLWMGVIATPLAVLLVVAGYRWIGGRGPALLGARDGAPARTPWWALAAVIVVAAAFGADQLAYHSQQIIVSRDPASYIQFGYWIARHGSLPIPADGAAFGGYSPLISFNSPAFYQIGHTVVPQFMAGLPMTLAPAYWISGINAATAMGTLLGTCGILVAGGLTARLVGPRWAPLGALLLALTLPEQFTSRSTYSEPLAQILFLGGMSLIVDSFSRTGARRSKLAALGGLALGLTLLARIDGLSDLLPLLPYAALLLITRARQAWPLIGGIIIGAGYGAVDGLVLSLPYLREIRGSLLPLLLIGALVFAACTAAVLIRWHTGLPVLRTSRIPAAAALAAPLATIILIIRPYLQTTRAPVTKAFAATMAGWQQAEHLPVDVTRQYYETSIHWVFWYAGIPAVILATAAAAWLTRRCLRGQSPAWTLPLMSFAWIIITVLWRPGITPDQPWASRRLVPGVLPGIIILALWATSRARHWLAARGADKIIQGGAVTLLTAALIIPPAITSWGLAITSGPGGDHLTANGLGTKTTFAGEVTAVTNMCHAIPQDASVLLTNGEGQAFSQVIRGMCGLPAAIVKVSTRANVAAAIAGVRRAGRQPVVLAPAAEFLAGYGGSPARHVLAVRDRGDAHTLVQAPLHTTTLHLDVWMSEFPK